MIQPGIAIPVYVDPIYNGETLSNSPQVEGLPIPAFQELYRKLKGAPPSGEIVGHLSFGAGADLRHGPADRAAAARRPRPRSRRCANATARLNNDQAFAADLMKALGFVPNYVTGPDTNRLARQTLTVRPETRAFVADYIKRANK